MRYRTKSGRVLTDDQVLLDASTGLARTGRTTGFFVYIFNLFTGAIALVNKLLFRHRLGVRSYGFFTLVFSLVFVYGVGLYHYSLQSLEVVASADEAVADSASNRIWYFLTGLFNNFVALFTEKGMYLFGGLSEIGWEEELVIILLMLGLLILYVVHKGEDRNIRKIGRKEELVHSLYRGESFFFKWLSGKKIGEERVEEWSLKYVADSLLVLFLVGWLYSFDFVAVGQILLYSQIFLLIEDYRVYRQEKSIKYDFVDGQIDSLYMLELQDEYERKEEEKGLYVANSGGRTFDKPMKKDFSKNKFRASI